MGTFPSEAPLQYRNKTSEISKIYRCNIKKYVKKLIKLFNSWIENSHRNMNTMFHATFTVKHAEIIVATSKINY